MATLTLLRNYFLLSRLELKVLKVGAVGEEGALNGNSSDELVDWDVVEIEGETIARYLKNIEFWNKINCAFSQKVF